MKIKKVFVLTVTAIIIVGIVIVGINLNDNLRENNLLIYSTGTKHKAFLNSTWEMSPREIERANSTKLSSSKLPLLFGPELIAQNRFKELSHDNVSLWGSRVKIGYTFFDNMLYKYYVSLDVVDLDESQKEILATLRKMFGEGRKGKKVRKDTMYCFEWDTKKQSLSYWSGKLEKEYLYSITIKAVYKPLYDQIKKIE